MGWGGGTQLAKENRDRALKLMEKESELIQATGIRNSQEKKKENPEDVASQPRISCSFRTEEYNVKEAEGSQILKPKNSHTLSSGLL